MIWIALLAAASIGRSHVNRAIVFDVDLDAGLFDDAADHLAARSDDVSDLIGRNVERVNSRRVLRHDRRGLSASPRTSCRGCAGGPRRACSSASFMIVDGDVRHLDIHLQPGDAVARAGDLEIHVAVVVFRARDVGQDGVLLAFHHQAHGDAAHVSGQRNAGIHQRQRGAADRGLRTGTVRFQNVADHAHGVGELVLVRESARSASARPERRGRFRGGPVRA